FGNAANPPPGPFDQRFRTACDLYNYGLGLALAQPNSTNALVVLAGGTRRLPVGQLELNFTQENFPWPMADFQSFLLAQQLLVRGLSVRNSQPGLGTPLVAVAQIAPKIKVSRSIPATVLLRLNGGLSDLAQGKCRGSLELYSGYDTKAVQIGER